MRDFKLFVIVLLLSCGSYTKLSKNNQRQSRDEKNLWITCEKEQKRLDNSDLIYHDKDLNRYVNRVMKNLLDSARISIKVEVKLIKSPYFNAFAYPNGKVYVHTGLLASVENEHQLATILGHEVNHAIHKHTLRQMNSSAATVGLVSILSAGTMIIGPGASLLGAVFGNVAANASISGHSKSLEYEADDYGIQMMKTAGYDYRESPKVFEILKEDLSRSKIEEPFFFGSHPKLQNRIDNYKNLIVKYGEPRSYHDLDSTDFKNQITKLYLDNADMNVSLNRPYAARVSLDRYNDIDSLSSRLHYLYGEVERLIAEKNSKDTDYSKAIKNYEKALTYNSKDENTRLRLAKIYYKMKNYEKAQLEFKHYIDLCNNCEEKSFANYYLKKIEKELE